MNVEFTGRQFEVTPLVRKQVEHGLAKLRKILGDNFDTHVILACEKHRCIAEIAITIRNQALVGIAEASDMTLAIGQSLDHIEKQTVKYKARWRTKKRHSHKRFAAAREPEEQVQLAIGASASTAVPLVVHTYPAIARTTEAHITRSNDSVAMKPMTLEEAIKEAEFRDREVFVFRDAAGKVKVLHRTKDGKMELIEAP